jgi:hypothetical protein
MRTTGRCANCQDEKELVSHGICAKCYMRERRRQEPAWLHGPDRSQSRSLKKLNRIRVNFARMLALLDETTVSPLLLKEEEYQLLRNMLIEVIDGVNSLQRTVVDNDGRIVPEMDLTRADGWETSNSERVNTEF